LGPGIDIVQNRKKKSYFEVIRAQLYSRAGGGNKSLLIKQINWQWTVLAV